MTEGKKIPSITDPVEVPLYGAEIVHKVATKFAEGITPMAVCELVKVGTKKVEYMDDTTEPTGIASKAV